MIHQSTKLIMNSVIEEYESLVKILNYQPQKQRDVELITQELINRLGQDWSSIVGYLEFIQSKSKKEHMLLFSFVQSVLQESYGHLNEAIETLKSALEKCNKEKIFVAKPMLYYRIALCYQRKRKYQLMMDFGKKMLKLSWYYKLYDYEQKSYYILSRASYGLQKMDFSVSLYNKYLDGYTAEREIKQLGINQLQSQLKQPFPHNRSPSQDEFDLNLLLESFNKDYLKTTKLIGGKKVARISSEGCKLCALYINNVKIQVDNSHPYNKNVVLSNDSRNRDYLNFYDSDQIDQLYKPKQTLPVLKLLLQKFKNA
ncbi:hypothetical protein pb186bvf_019586 [Paramecium bursaria]